VKAAIRRIGNSHGIILPKPLLSQLNLGAEVELTVEQDAIVLRKPRKPIRHGWKEAGKRLAEEGDDHAVWPAFANRGDAKLKW
jgi:antitoxin MazE